ncbi:septum formation initiator family protein [Arthrobacter sp. M2012083]|uniref:FtsB family cell division protein n=1 Tax=Arthrobacter sp. M2012083 TaxID=1197706 RepID=UPI000304418E|nr:septum formation initiator family protein [Arthrobacter sp. M2012083]
MATRRPKVPRADALGRPSSGARPASAGGAAGKGSDVAGSEGADVITAEFGGPRASSKTAPAAGPKAPANSKAPTDAKKSSDSKPAGTSPKAADKAKEKPWPGARDDRELDPVPAKAFSGRMLALAVVMIAITILLAPTVKIFLEKRAEISALEAEIASRKAEQTELNKQLSRWQDPNYVKQQARDRINMVMPGETGYWVFGGEEAAGTPGGRTGSGSSANPENLPWVDALWESIRRSATD